MREAIAMAEFQIFLVALGIAYLLPGPDMILLLQTGAMRGRRAALATVIGLGAARSIHVALAGLGLAALLQAAPGLFDAIRFVGAAYLAWLALGILRAPSLVPPDLPEAAGSRLAPAYGAAIRRGLLTNLLNPKALLFCSVLLPQFVHPGSGGVAGQFAALGLVLVAVGAAFDTAFALAGAGLGRFLARHRALEAVQRWLFASLLGAFAARLAIA
jgi:threonine/homoserine/homoserine lactone efflux protein